MNNISSTQETIYNLYLKSLRKANNLPFRERKDFEKIEDDKKIHLNKLDVLFKKYPLLFSIEYFDAPYVLDDNKEKRFYPLSYYSSYKGISTITAYYKLIQNKNPDDQLDFVKTSLKFIIGFCKEKKIPLTEYGNCSSVFMPDFLQHLKNNKISWYVIFDIPYLYDIIYNLSSDEFELMFGSLDLNTLQKKYNNSIITKEYVKIMVKKIEKYLLNFLAMEPKI